MGRTCSEPEGSAGVAVWRCARARPQWHRCGADAVRGAHANAPKPRTPSPPALRGCAAPPARPVRREAAEERRQRAEASTSRSAIRDGRLRAFPGVSSSKQLNLINHSPTCMADILRSRPAAASVRAASREVSKRGSGLPCLGAPGEARAAAAGAPQGQRTRCVFVCLPDGDRRGEGRLGWSCSSRKDGATPQPSAPRHRLADKGGQQEVILQAHASRVHTSPSRAPQPDDLPLRGHQLRRRRRHLRRRQLQ